MRKGAIIVETRVIPNLFEIIQDGHMKFVPLDWGLTLFLSEQNKHLIKSEMFEGRNVEIIILPFDNFSVADYNNLLTCRNFYECLDYDKILFFQTDSRIIRSGIDDFLIHDYIGACWKFQNIGGNGGFSLRSKDVMLKIIDLVAYNFLEHGNEDIYFSNLISSVGGKLATREQCMQFSVESIFGFGSLGYHAIEKYLSEEECYKIKNQYV